MIRKSAEPLPKRGNALRRNSFPSIAWSTTTHVFCHLANERSICILPPNASFCVAHHRPLRKRSRGTSAPRASRGTACPHHHTSAVGSRRITSDQNRSQGSF